MWCDVCLWCVWYGVWVWFVCVVSCVYVYVVRVCLGCVWLVCVWWVCVSWVCVFVWERCEWVCVVGVW